MLQIQNFGVGTDIENISRFKKFTNDRNNSFLHNIFTEDELDFCFSKKDVSPHLAARFSAKEAVYKSLSSIGVTIQNKKDIEIITNHKGVPTVKINNKKYKKLNVKISMSHCNDKSIAFAIATKDESRED